MNTASMTWLAADYHLPLTYSCRLPSSSMSSGLVSPAPGPATVRLALIRMGIELFGLEVVRDTLFPHIRSASIRIRPPQRVSLSGHLLRGYKVEEEKTGLHMRESLLYRHMAHAEGSLTIAVEVPTADVERWENMFMSIGYWGQACSFASCTGINRTPPHEKECLTPLRRLLSTGPLSHYFSCLLTEFRDPLVTWGDILPEAGSCQSQPLTEESLLFISIQDNSK